jgi:hypothetical protein
MKIGFESFLQIEGNEMDTQFSDFINWIASSIICKENKNQRTD